MLATWYPPSMYIVGVDEAGRGPLAGPVAVGVIRVEEGFDIFAAFPGLNDSKKLSEKKREALFLLLQEEIKKRTVAATVHLASAAKIDAHGIVPAVRGALATGVRKLLSNPTEGTVFLDGSLKAPKEYEQKTIIGGDGKVPAIMLASIVAKVTRDRYMKKVAEQFPQYEFELHKGYGTKRHYELIRAHGSCAIHRQTFLHLEPTG